MWKEWLERTLTRGASDEAAAPEPHLFDAAPADLPVPANANLPDPPAPGSSPGVHRADAGECVDA